MRFSLPLCLSNRIFAHMSIILLKTCPNVFPLGMSQGCIEFALLANLKILCMCVKSIYIH